MAKRQKYFTGVLKEKAGERENYFDYIIEAVSISQARSILDKYAKSFFEDGSPEKYNGGYDFFDGEIWVGVNRVERTSKAAWLRQQFERCLLKR